MKKEINHGMPQELKDRWKTRFHSVWNRISRGAASIVNMMPHAHHDNWRRKDKVQAGHFRKPNQHK
ncbi:MAG: hypothetical protein NTX86_03735 [Candidatus Dependentiae bacterium]|nr:hypothetical protein [Candidatus Dependentiae bacterium]